jgi:RNA polymerase sigma factor (sigma-70 family)
LDSPAEDATTAAAGGSDHLMAGSQEPGNVTRLLDDVERGEPHAADALLPLVYEHLRELARHRMAGERTAHTLQATALVHEAFLRLVGGERGAHWGGRAHFFHAAAEAMRRILIEHARARGSVKRGGAGRGAGAGGAAEDAGNATEEGRGAEAQGAGGAAGEGVAVRPRRRVPMNVVDLAVEHDPAEILDLDEAICRLEQESPDLAAVVRLRFYAGLSIEETAQTLGCSAQTVKRDWSYARAWLFHHLGY